MYKTISEWYHRYFSDPQAVVLTFILIFGFAIIIYMGDMLMPALAALVIAYLLEGLVRFMQSYNTKRIRAVVLVFSTFMAFLIFFFGGVVPLVISQLTEFLKEVPTYLAAAQQALVQIPEHVPYITDAQIRDILDEIDKGIASFGQQLLTGTLASIPSILTVVVYAILVPLLVFFFLKDKEQILKWSFSFLPAQRDLMSDVWGEVDRQIGNYIRGKVWEILIIGVATYIVFAIFGLKYALLLSAIVGLSVLIPYIGATVVTIPVAAVAYFQWGISEDFWYLVMAYFVVQALDGNVVVPLLFSEVVNLHPVAIIISILIFGGLWGFWGVFFAIPLGTLVNALLIAWPRIGREESSVLNNHKTSEE